MGDNSLTQEADAVRAKLPEKDRKILEEERQRLLLVTHRMAGAALMVRNFSHGKGGNVRPKVKR